MTRISLILLAALLLVSCSTPVDLSYRAPPQPAPDDLKVDRVIVTDERATPGTTVGAVMGTDGTPLRVLTVTPDAADVVRQALRDALAARQALAADPTLARYDLRVHLLALQGEQFVVRQAGVDMVLQLIDRRSGREVYSGRIYAEQRGDNYLTLEYQLFGSPTALGAVTRQTLNEAIDRALDRAGLALAAR